MSNNVNLVAFGTFGNPNGFTQTFFIGNSSLSKNIRTFDINTSALNLFPGSKVYSIRKDFVNSSNIIAYSVYNFAKEQNSTRGGTFIGSSILFTDKIADENITINCLNEFNNNLTNKNVKNDIITVTHSDNFSVAKPKDFDKIDFHLKAINNLDFIQTSNMQLVVYCETQPSKLQYFLKKSIDLLNVYDTIYFTESSEVAEFSYEKGIFKLIKKDGFEQEIELFHKERKRKIDVAASDFEEEIKRLKEDKNKTLNNLRDQIEQNEKIHQHNEKKIKESKNDLDKVEEIYTLFSLKIKDLANQLKSDTKLDEVKKIYSENKRLFIEGVAQIKKPELIDKISPVYVRSDLQNEPKRQEYTNDYKRTKIIEDTEEPKISILKVAAVAFFFLLIGTLGYFLFFTSREDSQPALAPKQDIPATSQDPSVPQQPTVAIQELNPNPNSELTENDYRLTAKKIQYHQTVEDVVKVIFAENPTDIQSNYAGQEIIYARKLIELNKNCFQEKDSIVFFAKDTLRRIPSYDKEK